MADSETVDTSIDTTQQVTSQSPKKHEKKTKRVAAGKAIAEKTRLAREAQKKALDEANAIISKNNIQTPKAANIQAPEAATIKAPEANNIQDADSETILTTTQWLSVFSIFISIVGIYFKREEIKALFVKKTPPRQGPVNTIPVNTIPVNTPPRQGPVNTIPVNTTPVNPRRVVSNMD